MRLRRGRPSVSPARRRASNALLLVGYPLATGAAVKLVPMFAERRTRRFLAFQAGTAAVVGGLVLRRRPVPAGLNAAALAGSTALWWARARGGLRPPRTPRTASSPR
jgi:hypothetical protein